MMPNPSQHLSLRRLITVVFAFAFICSSVSPAWALSTFTVKTDWESAILALNPTATFMSDPFGTPIAQAQSITFDSGVESLTSAPPHSAFPNDNSVSGGVYQNTLDPDGIGNVVGMDGFEFIDWTFPMAILGFGADFSDLDTNEIQITGNFDGTGDTTVTPSNGFFGVVGMASFSSIRFSSMLPADLSVGNNFDVFEIDNLAFAKPGSTNPPPTVPEPSTMVLLGSGLAGLIGWHYRKNHHK